MLKDEALMDLVHFYYVLANILQSMILASLLVVGWVLRRG